MRCNIGANCLVNGAAWYQTSGSSQDYMFHFRNSADMTLEVTSTKRPFGDTLPGHYDDQKDAIHAFMMWPARKGARKATAAS